MDRIPLSVRKSVRRFPWKFFLSVVLFVLCASAGAVFGLAQWMSRDLPDIARMAAIAPPVRTAVYDVKGREISAFFKENREVVPLKAIPKNLVNATLSTEDRHFYRHWGVDLGGIARAALTNLLNLRTAQGGSTITQQLARNLFLTHARTLDRKLKELIIALRIEKMYSKQEILEMYFNQIYYGNGAYGVEAAARTYFGKDVRQLNLTECALLAGLPQNPTGHSPYRQPKSALSRRNVVLKNMLDTHTITPEQYETAIRAPLGVVDHVEGAGLAPYFVEMVRQYLDDKYGSNLVYEGGLKVYTSLDLDLQRVAEACAREAPRGHGAALQVQEHARLVRRLLARRGRQRRPCRRLRPDAVRPGRRGRARCQDRLRSGDGRRARLPRLVVQPRDPGAAAAGLGVQAVHLHGGDRQRLPADATSSSTSPSRCPAACNGAAWTPHNYDGKWRGPVTLRYALQMSINIPAIKLLRKLGVSLVASYARRMGIKSPIQPNLSMALGTSEVSLLELTSAYAVLANEGIRNEPAFVLKVEDKSGAVLEAHQPAAGRRAAGRDRGHGDQHDAERHRSRHGLPGARHGLHAAGGRQDRHDRRLLGRVVRRLHAEPRVRGVGRVRRQAADGPGRDRRGGRAADVDRVHDGGHARAARSRTSSCRARARRASICTRRGSWPPRRAPR